jgi:hypothetical protein
VHQSYVSKIVNGERRSDEVIGLQMARLVRPMVDVLHCGTKLVETCFIGALLEVAISLHSKVDISIHRYDGLHFAGMSTFTHIQTFVLLCSLAVSLFPLQGLAQQNSGAPRAVPPQAVASL